MESTQNPYKAPSVVVEQNERATLQPVISPYGAMKDHTKLAKVCMVLLGLNVLYDAICSVLALKFALDYDRGIDPFHDAEGMENTMSQLYYEDGNTAGMTVFYVTVVVFCMWTVRSMKNAWATPGNEKRPKPEITPGWAVGYYFLPIVNWFRPYQGMKEIWQYSFNFTRKGAIVIGWWLCWVIGNITSYVVLQMEAADNTEAANMFRAELIGNSLLMASGILLIMIVSRVTKKQVEVYSMCKESQTGTVNYLSEDNLLRGIDQ